MTGISWMLQEAAQCPPEDYLVYDDHLGEEELASGEFDTVEYEYSYDVKPDKVCWWIAIICILIAEYTFHMGTQNEI